MIKGPITWPQVGLAAVIVIPGCLLIWGLVKAGENIAGIAAAVGAILAAMGWQHSRTKAALDELRGDVGKVEKLSNGNLSRAEAARAEAERLTNEQIHAIYQQLLPLAVAASPGTVIPPLQAIPVLSTDRDTGAHPVIEQPAAAASTSDAG